jgi:hypothetical protein
VHNCPSVGGDDKETWHPTLRGGERGIDANEVRKFGELYYPQDGHQVYVLRGSDGWDQVLIRDTAMGKNVTVQWSPDSYVQRQISHGNWFRLDE